MGAALGLLTGVGLRALGNYQQAQAQQKQQHELLWDKFMQDNLNKNPEAAATPAGQKELKRMYGEHAEAASQMLGMAAQAKKQQTQQFGSMVGGGGSTTGSLTAEQLQERIQHGQQFLATNPDKQHADLANKLIQQDMEQLKSLTQQQQFGQRQVQQRQEFDQRQQELAQTKAQTLAIQENSRASAESGREQALAMRQAALEETKRHNADIEQLNKQKSDDSRQAKTQDIIKSLASRADKIAADSVQKSGDYTARINAYNADAGAFYGSHAGEGGPTLLKYEESPGPIDKATGGALFNVNKKLVAKPAEYRRNKKTGEVGWIDADNNFYPDLTAGTPDNRVASGGSR